MIKTLADKISRNLSRVNIKKASVEVPRLRVRNKKNSNSKKDDKIPISSIVNILIKSAIEKVRREKKEKQIFEEDKSYTILKEDKSMNFGGYGTVSKVYGNKPSTSYVDYNKLFSYLGKFRAKSPYENLSDDHVARINKALADDGFSLIDGETMEKGKTYVRYFNSKIPIDKSSLVPIAGMNSVEWEQFKMWMRLDTAMYLLKISTS